MFTSTRHLIRNLSILAVSALPVVKSAVYSAQCQLNSECVSIYTSSYVCINNHCQRKPLSFNTVELSGALLIVVISMIANAGGLGAGAVIIPVYIFVYGYSTTDSIPLSKVTIFAGALINVFFIWNKRHITNKNRFLINYSLAATMIPLLLAGTMLGVLLSKLLPAVIITGALIGYLGLSIIKLYFRGLSAHKKEQEIALLQSESEFDNMGRKKKDTETIQERELNEISPDDQEKNSSKENAKDGEQNESQMDLNIEDSVVDQVKRREEPEVLESSMVIMSRNFHNLFFMVLSFFIILCTALIRGGHGSPSLIGLEDCSILSWLAFAVCQIVCLLISMTSYTMNVKIFKEQDQDSTVPASEQHLRRTKLLMASYLTGTAAGTLGIGGGMILGPFMLAMDMDPQISTALSGFTVLFTSLSTSTQFLIAGAFRLDQAWFFMVSSLIGSIIGAILLSALIAHYKKPSLLIWIIFGILVIAAFVLPIQMISNMFSAKKGLFSFGSFCQQIIFLVEHHSHI